MEILKHGNAVHKFKERCPNCGCEFIVDRSETYTFSTPIGLVARCGAEPKVYRFCDCPDCGKMVGVNEAIDGVVDTKEHEQNQKENNSDNDSFLHCTRLKDCPPIPEEVLKKNAISPMEIAHAYMDIMRRREEDSEPKGPFMELLNKFFGFSNN